MIGNDIVDLNEASRSRHWNNQRFLSKVFSTSERDFILNSSNHLHATWGLWSMKESAYKVHLRKYKKPFFAPLKIECQFEPEGSGKIMIDNAVYTANTIFREDYIYTVAVTDPSKEYTGKIQRVTDTSYKNLHNKSYQDVIDIGSVQFHEHPKAIEIKKDEYGIPTLFTNNKEQPMIFSITHHGKYYAYAILK